jgi:hypothetical protein
MKKLAITMGDPGGVGPEIIAKALKSPALKNSCIPIVIGDASVIEEALKLCKIPLSLRIIRSPEEAFATEGLINFIHVIPPTPPFPHSGGFAEAKQKWGKEKSKVETFKKNKPTAEGGGGKLFLHTYLTCYVQNCIFGLVNLFKYALSYAAYRAYPVIRQVFKRDSMVYPTFGITILRVIDIAAGRNTLIF